MKTRKLHIRTKFIIIFLALAVLLSAGIGALTYTLNYRRVVEQYANLATSAAKLAVSEIDGDAVSRYLANGEDDSYRETAEQLRKIKQAFSLKYLYVILPDVTQTAVTYVFDIALPGDDETLISPLGAYTREVDVYDILINAYSNGVPYQQGAITRTEFGYLISAYEPIPRADGTAAAVVGVDIEMSVLLDAIAQQTRQMVLVSMGVILLFLVLLLIVVNRQMIQPINGLSRSMAAFNKDADQLEIQTYPVRTGDELEVMAGSFQQMAGDIQQYVEHLRSVTAEKERIATELNVATRIQSSMLPRIFPYAPERDEFDIFATMEPAKEVGGDFYDFFILGGTEQTGTHLGFLIADVSGKGVPAALFMMTAKTLIKDHALHGESPATIFSAVNRQLCDGNDENMFVTAFMGVVELATGKLTFANAGHNPPVLCRSNGESRWMNERPGLVLACMDGVKYADYELQLEKGDRLFLYTDGVTEAMNPQEQLFGETRLMEVLTQGDNRTLPAMQLLPAVRAAVSAFADGAEQADDITMLAVDWLGQGGRHI